MLNVMCLLVFCDRHLHCVFLSLSLFVWTHVFRILCMHMNMKARTQPRVSSLGTVHSFFPRQSPSWGPGVCWSGCAYPGTGITSLYYHTTMSHLTMGDELWTLILILVWQTFLLTELSPFCLHEKTTTEQLLSCHYGPKALNGLSKLLSAYLPTPWAARQSILSLYLVLLLLLW